MTEPQDNEREALARLIDPVAWEDAIPHSEEFYPGDPVAQERYERFFWQGVRSRRAPSLEAADRILTARKHLEPEAEYDYRVEGDWMVYRDMENLREDWGDTDRPILRRRKAGEWEKA